GVAMDPSLRGAYPDPTIARSDGAARSHLHERTRCVSRSPDVVSRAPAPRTVPPPPLGAGTRRGHVTIRFLLFSLAALGVARPAAAQGAPDAQGVPAAEGAPAAQSASAAR